jgi:hypothetical protein
VTQFPEQVSAPKNHIEFMALAARRSELQGQLRALGDRRSELATQISHFSSDAAVNAEPLARLKVIDADIKRVEATLRSANEQIEAAMAKGLGYEQSTPEPPGLIQDVGAPPPPTPDFHVSVDTDSPWQNRLGQTLATTVPITAATVILLGAVLYWRLSRSVRNQLNRILGAQSGRLDELQRSIDTVAVEVERVSENQRFVTKLVGEKSPGPAGVER